MSDVTKRDKRVRIISQLYATIKRDHDTATAAMVDVWKRQLEADWEAFERLQDAVLDRAGSSEMEEQHKVYDACLPNFARINGEPAFMYVLRR